MFIRLKAFARNNGITYQWLWYRIRNNYYKVEKSPAGFNISADVVEQIKTDWKAKGGKCLNQN